MIILYAIITYFIWAYIHEYAHLFGLKDVRKVKSYKFKLYPHNHPELGFVFASVSYDYDEELTEWEKAYVAFMPRIPDYAAVLILPLIHMFYNDVPLFLTVILLGGYVDLLRGTYTRNQTADILRYCDGFEWCLLNTIIFQILTCIISFSVFLLLAL